MKSKCYLAGKCLCANLGCIGSEHHYMYCCIDTKGYWGQFIPEIRKRTGIELDLPRHMLAMRKHVTIQSWRTIGIQLSRCIEAVLNYAEDPNCWNG